MKSESTQTELPEPLSSQAAFWSDRLETNLRELNSLETKAWQALGHVSSSAGLLGHTLQRATLQDNLHLLNESTLQRLLGMAETTKERLDEISDEILSTQVQLEHLIDRIEDHVRASR